MTTPARTRGVTTRPHQEAALRDLQAGLRTPGSRGMLVQACGTGKSLQARWLLDVLDCRLSVYVTPTLTLVAQTLSEWTRVDGHINAYVVCSDATTSAGINERGGTIDTTDPTSPDAQLTALRVAGVSTSAGELAAWLRQDTTRRQVIVTTYSSIDKVMAGLSDSGRRADLLVADEAHKIAGTAGPNDRLCVDPHQPIDRHLYMTATPVIPGRWGTAHGSDPFNPTAPGQAGSTEATLDALDAMLAGVSARADDDAWKNPVLSMDNPAVFGPVLHRLRFADAIDKHLLADYQVLLLAVADSGGAKANGRRGRGTTSTDAALHLLAQAVMTHGARKILTFHNRVETARQFAALAPEVLEQPCTAVAVDGRMNAQTRAKHLHALADSSEDHVHIVASARCLSEGTDVPACDAVLLADPRASAVDIVQIVGRVLRKAPDKTHGIVAIPVVLPAGYFDTDGNLRDDIDVDSPLLASAFGHAWKVLRALRSHDERISNDLDALTRQLPRSSAWWRNTHPERRDRPGSPWRRIQLTLPDGASDTLARTIASALAVNAGSAWSRMHHELQAYCRTHQTLPPTNYSSPTGSALGSWIVYQRSAYRKGTLPHERIEALEALEHWTWNADDALTSKALAALRRIESADGTAGEHEAGPSRYGRTRIRANVLLGHWLAGAYLAHLAGTLDADTATHLESISGITLSKLPGDTDHTHARHLLALQQFHQRTGHVNPAAGTIETYDGTTYRIGAWMTGVRLARQTGALPPIVEHAIMHIGPQSELEGRWLMYKPAMQSLLGLAGMHAYLQTAPPSELRTTTTYTFPTSHDEVTRLLATFHGDGVHCLDGDADMLAAALTGVSVNIGQWASNMRMARRRGKLSVEMTRALETITGWQWDAPGRQPHNSMAVVLKDGEQHGHVNTYHYRKCRCEECTRAQRAYQREHTQHRRMWRHLGEADAVAVTDHQRQALSDALAHGIIPAAIAAQCGLSVRAIAPIADGRWPALTPAVAMRLAAFDECAARDLMNAPRSRGRIGLSDKAYTDPQETLAAMARLARQGFGPAWVARELGQAPNRDAKRIPTWLARGVADLEKRLGGRTSGVSANQKVPSLHELDQAARPAARQSGGSELLAS